MKQRWVLGFVVLTSFAAPIFACPTAESADGVPPTLLWELSEWIAGHTDYSVTNTQISPPAVFTCVTGDRIAYEGQNILVSEDLRGAYSLPDRAIFLVSPWVSENIEDRGRLLHELVHDVQFQNAHWACPQAAEDEAYHLTALWLEEHGVTPEVNWFAIYLLSRCPSDIHP